jgi:ABC-2 type transport system permease protein
VKPLARVFLYEFRRQGRRRAYLFVSIGLPLLALLAFYAYQLYIQARPANPDLAGAQRLAADIQRPVGLVDESGKLTEPPSGLSSLKVYKSQDEALTALHNGKIVSYYVITKDYLTDGIVNIFFDRFSLSNLNSPAVSDWIVQNLAYDIGKDPNSDLINRLEAQPKIALHSVSETNGVQQTTNTDTSFLLAYLFCIILIFAAFMTSGYLMQSIVEEKETRMIEILLSSMRPIQLLAGKILALGLLGLLQMACWAVVAVYILGKLPAIVPEILGLRAPSVGQIMIMIVYFILGYLLLSTVYASIGALSTNMREGPQLAAFVSLPMIIPMYLLQVIASTPNGAIAVGLSLFPLTAPLAMISRAAVVDVPPLEIGISVILLTLTILLALWLAGRLFRVSTLLAGQLPKLRDLARLVRDGA